MNAIDANVNKYGSKLAKIAYYYCKKGGNTGLKWKKVILTSLYDDLIFLTSETL